MPIRYGKMALRKVALCRHNRVVLSPLSYLFYHLYHGCGYKCLFHSEWKWLRGAFEWGGQVLRGVALHLSVYVLFLLWRLLMYCVSLFDSARFCVYTRLCGDGGASIAWSVYWSEVSHVMLAACHVERLSGVICKEGGWRWSNEVCLSGVCCWKSKRLLRHTGYISAMMTQTHKQTDRHGKLLYHYPTFNLSQICFSPLLKTNMTAYWFLNHCNKRRPFSLIDYAVSFTEDNFFTEDYVIHKK